MSFDLRNEKMQPAALFGKAVLFTPQHIDAQDVHPGWECYDLRGTRQCPDEPAFLEDESYLYRLGSVLSPVPLKKLFTTSKRVSGQFQSLGDPITLQEFCRDWSLEYPFPATGPASIHEAGLSTAPRPGDWRDGPMKPDCALIGQDGNIFNLIGIASRTLRENGLEEQATEMRERIMGGDCGNYHEALNIIGEYVNITGPEEQENMTMGGS